VKRKPVVDATVETAFDYEYQAHGPDMSEYLASDSLVNLKKVIRKDTNWKLAWITCNTGCFSVGQTCVDAYPYCPRK
jgi:hypothetical protein